MAYKLFYTFFVILLATATNATSTLHDKTPIVIDTFHHPDTNDMGYWHGTGENLHIEYNHIQHYVRLYPTDPDQNYHTQVSPQQTCTSLATLQDHFLHVVFSGPETFSISLNQHNNECLPGRNPYPATWDSVQAGRYKKARGCDHNQSQDVYVPLSHFKIDLSRVISISFSGFVSKEPVTFRRVEIVKILPAGTNIPSKLPSGTMALRCTRPNSFAFGIDDGQPWLARRVMDILAEENVLVTFFAVGEGLRNPETNLTEVYREMVRRGHQIALHSSTHRKYIFPAPCCSIPNLVYAQSNMNRMEGLPDEDIDNEIKNSITVFRDKLGVESAFFIPQYLMQVNQKKANTFVPHTEQ